MRNEDGMVENAPKQRLRSHCGRSLALDPTTWKPCYAQPCKLLTHQLTHALEICLLHQLLHPSVSLLPAITSSTFQHSLLLSNHHGSCSSRESREDPRAESGCRPGWRRDDKVRRYKYTLDTECTHEPPGTTSGNVLGCLVIGPVILGLLVGWTDCCCGMCPGP